MERKGRKKEPNEHRKSDITLQSMDILIWQRRTGRRLSQILAEISRKRHLSLVQQWQSARCYPPSPPLAILLAQGDHEHWVCHGACLALPVSPTKHTRRENQLHQKTRTTFIEMGCNNKTLQVSIILLLLLLFLINALEKVSEWLRIVSSETCG